MRACRWFTRRGPLSCPLLLDQNLYRKFVRDEEPPAEFSARLGQNRYYNVDLIPKFIMANGEWPLKTPRLLIPRALHLRHFPSVSLVSSACQLLLLVRARCLTRPSARVGVVVGGPYGTAAVLVRWCTGSDR